MIPSALRKSLNLRYGDKLVVRKVGESLVLKRREDIIKRLKGRFSHIPRHACLADELVTERQEDAISEVLKE